LALLMDTHSSLRHTHCKFTGNNWDLPYYYHIIFYFLLSLDHHHVNSKHRRLLKEEDNNHWCLRLKLFLTLSSSFFFFNLSLGHTFFFFLYHIPTITHLITIKFHFSICNSLKYLFCTLLPARLIIVSRKKI